MFPTIFLRCSDLLHIYSYSCTIIRKGTQFTKRFIDVADVCQSLQAIAWGSLVPGSDPVLVILVWSPIGLHLAENEKKSPYCRR